MRKVAVLLLLSAVLAACSTAPRARTPSPGVAPRKQPPPHRVHALPALLRATPSSVFMDSRLDATLDSVVDAGIRAGAAPGAVLLVGRYGRIVEDRGFGHTDTTAFSPAPDDSTIWDLASLTKVVATTTAAMVLQEEGKLDIDRPVRAYLPEFDAPEKASITVRMLLEHRGGLEAGSALWSYLRGKAEFLREINSRPLAYTPGYRPLYSDWGFVLLGFIIERLGGRPLDHFLQERVFGPLGMKNTGFNPLAPAGMAPLPAYTDCTATLKYALPHPLARIAPTGWDTWYRHAHLQGIVHDPNACAMGGVAGHAGLFSSGRDLAIFAQMMLNGGIYNGVRILHPATIAAWTARQNPASSRALGWDTPSPHSSAGRFFGPRSFGHTGYTGTSIWLDPERGLFVILLTNRVNPTSQNTLHKPLRRAVADAAQQAILDAPLINWEVAAGH